MKKKLLSVLLAATMTLSLAACSSNSSKESSDKKSSKVEEMSFDEMKKEAKGTTVTFYGWGGDEVLNKWLDDVFAPDMKEKYDIKMERVPMDIDQILSQLSGEMEANKKDGDIDMIWINGENFKPLLADAVYSSKNVDVLNYVNITDLLTENGRVYGAVGFSIMEETAYVIHAKAVLIATGGAAGLYKPNNPGFSRHKMWYPPFNTGAGYAMGIRCGAEMTTFEMRFIALRCKDTIAPTGTIAQGVQAKQVNSKGEVYEHIYGLTTSQRVYGTVRENQLGHGPCYLQTSGITSEQDQDLLKAYLNMAPSQTLKWIESGKMPGEQDVEIQGTEPYIVGGHTASGFWVDTKRETTIHGLYAAGDVAGGCPQKYVTGALAEGKIASLAIIEQLKAASVEQTSTIEDQAQAVLNDYKKIRSTQNGLFTIDDLEEAMQKVMDEYAGGIASNYQFNEKQLKLAEEKIARLNELAEQIGAEDMHELLFAYELKERLLVCQVLIEHLKNRKETRWHSFNENLDHPEKDEKFEKYVNSRMEDGKLHILFRDLVKGDTYEHTNS